MISKNRFYYGIAALVLGSAAIVLFVVALATNGWNPIALKFVWVPVVWLWGLAQVRSYLYWRKHNPFPK